MNRRDLARHGYVFSPLLQSEERKRQRRRWIAGGLTLLATLAFVAWRLG